MDAITRSFCGSEPARENASSASMLNRPPSSQAVRSLFFSRYPSDAAVRSGAAAELRPRPSTFTASSTTALLIAVK